MISDDSTMLTAVCCDSSGRLCRAYGDGEVIIAADPNSSNVLKIKHREIAVALCFASSLDHDVLFIAFRNGDVFCFNMTLSENHRIELLPNHLSDEEQTKNDHHIVIDSTSMSARFNEFTRTFHCVVGFYTGHVALLVVSLDPTFKYSIKPLTPSVLPLPTNTTVTSIATHVINSQTICCCTWSDGTVALTLLGSSVPFFKFSQEGIPLNALIIPTFTSLGSRPLLIVSSTKGLVALSLSTSSGSTSFHLNCSCRIDSSDDPFIRIYHPENNVNRIILGSQSGKLHSTTFSLSKKGTRVALSEPLLLSDQELPGFPVGIVVDCNDNVSAFDSQNYSISCDFGEEIID
ncbi:hypothetical protein P9112_008723 [Eukaryota sp. TZLM1-RC]